MTPRFHPVLLTALLCWLGLGQVQGQAESRGQGISSTVFHSLEEVLDYTDNQSLNLRNDALRLDQAKKAKLAAVLGTVDITGALLSAQFTNNTNLGVNLFPAEIFGGEPGTFREVEMGVQYNTNLTNYADVKLINPAGWSNLKLANINIDLSSTNQQVSRKNLQENIAANYYNIVSLQEQIESSKQNLAASDTLHQIVVHKYEEGLVKQQDVNDSKVNYLNTQESLHQLEYLLEQYYISLKLLCDIPEETAVNIQPGKVAPPSLLMPSIQLNGLELEQARLQEAYALQSYKGTKAAYLPSLSLQLSNSNNLYNTEFEPFTGNWINSNYIGVNLNIPIPSSQRVSQTYAAKYDYQMAINQTEQARIKASLDQKSLKNEYEKAQSQARTNREILSLRQDTFYKNQELYREGLISLEQTINSFNAMVNAQYALISSEVSVDLALSNINIHNNIR
ncbi:MAG: TolC family protein [Bacteroidota bacterium]